MKQILLLLFSVLLILSVVQFSACGSSSSGNPDPTLDEVEKALLSVYNKDDAFVALISAFAKGYSLQQIVDGAIAGLLLPNGDIRDSATDTTTAPTSDAVGTVSARASVLVAVETRFLTLEDSFLEEVGVDFDLSALEIPLQLSETGHTNFQILDGIDRQAIQNNPETGFFGVLNNTEFLTDSELEFILRAVERSEVIALIVEPTVATLNPAEEQTIDQTFPEDESQILPEVFGPFSVYDCTNNQTVIRNDDPAVTVEGTFRLTNTNGQWIGDSSGGFNLNGPVVIPDPSVTFPVVMTVVRNGEALDISILLGGTNLAGSTVNPGFDAQGGQSFPFNGANFVETVTVSCDPASDAIIVE